MAGEYQDLRIPVSGVDGVCIESCLIKIASRNNCMTPRELLLDGQRDCFLRRSRQTEGMNGLSRRIFTPKPA